MRNRKIKNRAPKLLPAFVSTQKSKIQNILDHGIAVTGVLHVGAHTMQELDDYRKLNIPEEKMYWIEGNPDVVQEMRHRRDKCKYIEAVISEVDGVDVKFNISSNQGQSSSILELGTHVTLHPGISYVKSFTTKTKTLNTVCSENYIKPGDFNMLNIDLQGAELLALRGLGGDFFEHIQYIELEINNEYVYKDCALVGQLDDFLVPLGFTRRFTYWIKDTAWGEAVYVKKDPIFDSFAPVYINMDARTDRCTHIMDELQKLGMQAERFRGLRSSDVSADKYPPTLTQKMTPGNAGCYLSHVEILNQELDKHFMILEDDAVFCSDFIKRLRYVHEWMEHNEWDIFFMNASFSHPPYWHTTRGAPRTRLTNCTSNYLERDAESTDDPRIVRVYGCFHTHSYIVNKNSSARIRNMLLDIGPQADAIDAAYIAIQPKINAFSFLPGMVKQLDSISDIKNAMHNYSAVMSKVNGTVQNSRYWYQERMEDYAPTSISF